MSRRFELDPASARCLDRTRSAVMSVLLLDGLAIAVSGILLRNRGPGITLWPPEEAYRWAHLLLLGLMFAGSAIRLIGASPPVLENPRRRRHRFFWSHVVSALLGSLALPIGFAYGWAVQPKLSAVGPFWAVSLVLGLLALPRTDELMGFDRPMSPSPPNGPGDPEGPDGHRPPGRRSQ